MNAWNPHTFGTCLQTYNAGSNPVFPVPTRKEIFTTPNHLFCLSPSLGHGKLLPQTVWALFQLRIWEIDILIVGDLFTKYIETAALSSIEIAIITQVFLDKIVFRHGPPHSFLTDRGTNFTSKLMTELCNDLNIHKIFTSSYHPQCDSFVELINGVIMQIIVMYVAADHKDWDTYLPSATCKHNNAWNPIMINMPRIIPSG